MQIFKYIFNRILAIIPVLIGITIVAFLLGVSAPGDPVEAILNRDGEQMVTQEQIDEVRERLGLDDPVPIQYIKWVKNALTGEFGNSFFSNKSIEEEMIRRLPITINLALVGLLFTIMFGIGFGVIMAMFKDTWIDKIIGSISIIMLSIPGFWLAIILILVFVEKLHLLPTSGYDSFKSLILPGIVVSCSTIGVCARLTKTSILDELGKQYILVANAKGMNNKIVILKHAFVNSLIPITTFIGTYFAGILGGAVVAEIIFSLPGIGSYVIKAVQSRDYFVVQAYVLFTGMVYVVMNLAIDLLYILINPKMRVGEK